MQADAIVRAPPSFPDLFRIGKESEHYLPLQRHRAARYLNRIWILTDGEVFSTGDVFCSLAKSHGRGVFVGAETGRAYQGFNAGELVVITLPSSQLRAVVPWLRFNLAVGKPPDARRGIRPDYPFEPSIADTQDDGDPDSASE
jgi:hypothetical protein